MVSFLLDTCRNPALEVKPTVIATMFTSAALRFHQSRQFVISVSILTVISPWGLTSFNAAVRSRFAAQRQIRSVRRSLTRQTFLTLVHALVVKKVDYCNSVSLCLGQTAVRAKRCRSADLLSKEVGAHQPLTAWTCCAFRAESRFRLCSAVGCR